MTRSEILNLAKKYFAEGRFDKDFLFTKGKVRTESEIAIAKDLLVNLWKKGEVTLT
jgi:hypothetical protein